jgi:hypothetical protein
LPITKEDLRAATNHVPGGGSIVDQAQHPIERRCGSKRSLEVRTHQVGLAELRAQRGRFVLP